jgi:hypothetical protein
MRHGVVAWVKPHDRETAMSNIKTPAHKKTKTKDEPGASVDEQIEDSFPASDPPSYAGGGRVGQPNREKEKEKRPAKVHK